MSKRSAPARRHHYVPRAYLERFAVDGQVAVRRRDAHTYRTNPLNVALECGLYDLPDDPVDASPRTEIALSTFDDDAIAAIRTIAATGRAPSAGSPERKSLANFLALQVSRTPEHRERSAFPERVRDYAAGREVTQELVTEYLERVHLGFKPAETEATAAWEFVAYMPRDPAQVTGERFVRSIFAGVPVIAPLLLQMNWTLEVDRKESLITSDMPLVIWRVPTVRDQFEGVGVQTADELRFPLDPAGQLVLSRRKRTPAARITAARARECNRDMAAACHEFIVAQPRRQETLSTLPLARRRPVLRFNTGPLYESAPNGAVRRKGEVLHMWVPRR